MPAMDQIAGHKIVPVVVLDDAKDAAPLADALVAGGLPIAEVTFRTAAAATSIKIMADRGDILVGAGTVLTISQVDAGAEAGAQYIVSPGTSALVTNRCKELGITSLPGATTATEVQAALELGLDVVKFFPAGTSGGHAAITALSAPFGNVRFIPTGGIGPSNLDDYLKIPSVIAVGGSWMVPRGLIREQKFDQIAELCHTAVSLTQPAQ